MNDIQVKENIYKATTAAVNKQQESVLLVAAQVKQAKEAYLQSVIRAAILSEKTRRKKDSLIKLAIYGGLAVIDLILLLINVGVGILFAIIVGCIAWVATQQKDEDRVANYNNRRAFFTKYAYAVPADEQLKWKQITISESDDVGGIEGGWVCLQCSAKNSDGSKFCVSCGAKKV